MIITSAIISWDREQCIRFERLKYELLEVPISYDLLVPGTRYFIQIEWDLMAINIINVNDRISCNGSASRAVKIPSL